MATVQPCLRPGGKRYKAVFFFLKKKKMSQTKEKINYTSDESVIKP